MAHWAIGLKGWVEIRSSKVPPQKVTSTVKRKSFKWDYTYDYDEDGNGYGERAKLPITLPLKVIIFKGGRTLHTLSMKKFKRLLGRSVRLHQVVELNPAQMAVIKKEFTNG